MEFSSFRVLTSPSVRNSEAASWGFTSTHIPVREKPKRQEDREYCEPTKQGGLGTHVRLIFVFLRNSSKIS